MASFSKEFSVYPCEVIVTSADGAVRKYPKARIAMKPGGDLGVYDTNVEKPWVFAEVFRGAAVDGNADKVGNTFSVSTVDGSFVTHSPRKGCGCGDPGKRYIYPQDYGDDIVKRMD